jgi:very-short-patch-repair endonuclease
MTSDLPGPYAQKLRRARELRAKLSPPEEILWRRIRAGQLDAGRIIRQRVLLGWIVDFYAPRYHLVIEVDGSQHDDQEEYDLRRDRTLIEAGFSVIRVTARAVFDDVDLVAEVLLHFLLDLDEARGSAISTRYARWAGRLLFRGSKEITHFCRKPDPDDPEYPFSWHDQSECGQRGCQRR